MRTLFLICLCLLLVGSSFAQNGDQRLHKLLFYSRQKQIDSAQFFAALKIFRKCEAKHELDVSARISPGDDESHNTAVSMFGKICLKSSETYAADEYIKFMQRQHGSADEEITFEFERLFVKWPGYVLNRIGSDKFLLDQLEWGFVNNHYKELKSENCKSVLYKLNPAIKKLYPLYKKQLDYIIATAETQLKS